MGPPLTAPPYCFLAHSDYNTVALTSVLLENGELTFHLQCIVLYGMVLCCIVLYCIVLYCIVLYCIVLYCIVSYQYCRLCFLLLCVKYWTRRQQCPAKSSDGSV
jgi:hypothetical protein